jgi:hypothetical protein
MFNSQFMRQTLSEDHIVDISMHAHTHSEVIRTCLKRKIKQSKKNDSPC